MSNIFPSLPLLTYRPERSISAASLDPELQGNEKLLQIFWNSSGFTFSSSWENLTVHGQGVILGVSCAPVHPMDVLPQLPLLPNTSQQLPGAHQYFLSPLV